MLYKISYTSSIYPADLGHCEDERDPVHTWTLESRKRVPCSPKISTRRTILWSESIIVRIAERLATAEKSAVRYWRSIEHVIWLI